MSHWMSYATSRAKMIFPNEVYYGDTALKIFVIHGPQNLCLQVGTVDYARYQTAYSPGSVLFRHYYPPRKGEDREVWQESLRQKAYDPIRWDQLEPRLKHAKIERSIHGHGPFIFLDTQWQPLFVETPVDTYHEIGSGVNQAIELARREGALQVHEQQCSEELVYLNNRMEQWEKRWDWVQTEKQALAQLRNQ